MQSKDFAVDVSDLHEGKLINISNNPYMIGVNYDADGTRGPKVAFADEGVIYERW